MRPSLAAEIYGRNDPREAPAYFISDAARYLHLPISTVRSWVLGRSYDTEAGTRQFQPLVALADAELSLLSFHNLVELHVLRSIRSVHGVRLNAVRRTIRFLRNRFQSKRPLLDQEMVTDGKDLFVERYGRLINTSADGQLEMRELLEAYLKRIDRDSEGVPIRLYPFTRPRIEGAPRLVSIDPLIRFGKPCIAGTGIPTAIIAERHEAGDSVVLLADDYGRTSEEIEEALRYENRRAS
jgi:uncharacterized protein (DUF433 family)